jgi:predicted transcriptional regulator of viral defense system
MTTNRQVAARDSADFFRSNPVFTLGQLSSSLGGPERRKRALERVKYFVSRGRVKPLARGLYAVVPPGVDAKTHEPDLFLVAHALRPDAVFSHHAALELLGAGHSVWHACTAFTGGRRTSLVLGASEVRFVDHPAPLRRRGLESLGVRVVHYRGQALRVTGRERTLLDGFRQPRLVGGLDELVESAAGFGMLDLDLLTRLLDAYGQRALWAAIGWFLERFARTFFVTPERLTVFEAHRPRSPQYVPRSLRGGKLVRRWNLVLPAAVVRGGEPDEPRSP